MTAINLWTTETSACLLVDQAWMANGLLLMVQTKIAKCPRLKMAVAYNGRSTTRTVSLMERWLNTVADQPTALAALDKLLGLIRMDAMLVPRNWQGSTTTTLFVAVWNSGPQACVVSNTITRVDKCQSPPTRTPLDHNALVDCMQEQRLIKGRHYDIGGNAELTTVTADGITSEIIHRWPDRLGEPIAP